MSDVSRDGSAAPSAEPADVPDNEPAVSESSEGGQGGDPSRAGETKSDRLIDALADLVQTAVDYLRHETGALVHEKIVVPIQRAGTAVAFALAASFLIALGLGFLFVALLLILAKYLTWPGALASIGAVLVIGAAAFMAMSVRSTEDDA